MKNHFEINRVLDVIRSYPPDIRRYAMPVGQREGGGPLPPIESAIHPLKTVKTEVVGEFGKCVILEAPDAVPREREPASQVCRD